MTYPVAAVSAVYVSGDLLAAPVTLSLLALSGYAAITKPMTPALETLQGAHAVLTADDTVPLLKARRDRIAENLRDFADKHAEPGLRGWWRDPAGGTEKLHDAQLKYERAKAEAKMVATPQRIAEAGLQTLNIPLKSAGKRHEGERAVLTFKQQTGNTRAMVWIPGRNDSFFHVHVLDRILGAGFDVYALDLRRCGRAKYSLDTGEETTPELMAHDSHDFSEYFEEVDAVLKFIKTPQELPTTGSIEDGGCGKAYESVVMYSHSTGGLVAALYGGVRH